jgi:hypothetical protein
VTRSRFNPERLAEAYSAAYERAVAGQARVLQTA